MKSTKTDVAMSTWSCPTQNELFPEQKHHYKLNGWFVPIKKGILLRKGAGLDECL